MDRPSRDNDLEYINLVGFCQQVGRAYFSRMRRQRVELQIDGDAAIWQWVPARRVRMILESLIKDALDAMPEGGELDLTIIPVAGGVEIEVADSREVVSLPVSHGADSRGATASDDADHPGIVRLETHFCPQGGVARTLKFQPRSIPASISDAHTSRRAA